MYKIGDRVRINDIYPSDDDHDLRGKVGVVKGVYGSSPYITVKLDKLSGEFLFIEEELDNA